MASLPDGRTGAHGIKPGIGVNCFFPELRPHYTGAERKFDKHNLYVVNIHQHINRMWIACAQDVGRHFFGAFPLALYP